MQRRRSLALELGEDQWQKPRKLCPLLLPNLIADVLASALKLAMEGFRRSAHRRVGKFPHVGHEMRCDIYARLRDGRQVPLRRLPIDQQLICALAMRSARFASAVLIEQVLLFGWKRWRAP